MLWQHILCTCVKIDSIIGKARTQKTRYMYRYKESKHFKMQSYLDFLFMSTSCFYLRISFSGFTQVLVFNWKWQKHHFSRTFCSPCTYSNNVTNALKVNILKNKVFLTMSFSNPSVKDHFAKCSLKQKDRSPQSFSSVCREIFFFLLICIIQVTGRAKSNGII